MKKIVFFMLLLSFTVFAEWRKVEMTDDFGDKTGKFCIENQLEGNDDIYAVYFINDIFAISCFDDQFDWNYNDDVKISIKSESGKIESLYSDEISNGIVVFDLPKATKIAKIFTEDKSVLVALITKNDKFIFTLDTAGFKLIYEQFKGQK